MENPITTSLHSKRIADLNRFYALIHQIQKALGAGNTVNSIATCPLRGVYFFLEIGQFRTLVPHDHRVVRIGTHALREGAQATLKSRLSQHRGKNHLQSVMRRHIGRALIAQNNLQHQYPYWGVKDVDRTVRSPEKTMESLVSEKIHSMPLTWVEIPDVPSPLSDRAYIEQNAIALLSKQPFIDAALSPWLGDSCPNINVKLSRLWNDNHVGSTLDDRFLDVFEIYVRATTGHGPMPSRSIGFHA